MEEDATLVLLALATHEQSPGDPQRGRHALDGNKIRIATKLEPDRINDAVALLDDSGYVEIRRYLGTAPYNFGYVELHARGRQEAERLLRARLVKASTTPRQPVLRNPPPALVADQRYMAIERRGEGAFGEVWRGEDRQLGRPVAIKFVRDELTNQDALAHARAIARVEHANIVVVYDVTPVLDPSTGAPSMAIVMQFVDGVTLAHLLQQQVPTTDARRIGTALLGAIDAYHRHDLAHLDLHAWNVLVTPTDVKVIDPSCSTAGYFRSTATRASQQARDVRDARDLILHALRQSSMLIQQVDGFAISTANADLPQLQGAFEDLFAVVPIIYEQPEPPPLQEYECIVHEPTGPGTFAREHQTISLLDVTRIKGGRIGVVGVCLGGRWIDVEGDIEVFRQIWQAARAGTTRGS